MVTQLVSKFPAFYWSWKFVTVFKRSRLCSLFSHHILFL